MDSALAAALALASKFLCFPCRRDKAPTCPHGFKDASRDAATLQQLWTNYPGPLIGVPTGAVSGIDALDIDAKHAQAREWWAANRVRLPPTRVHRTRSAGLHCVFQHTAGLSCSVGRVARGVDVRADGGYAIWWPAAGLPVLHDGESACWPAWLLQLLQSPLTSRALPSRRVRWSPTIAASAASWSAWRPQERANEIISPIGPRVASPKCWAPNSVMRKRTRSSSRPQCPPVFPIAKRTTPLTPVCGDAYEPPQASAPAPALQRRRR